MLIVEWPTAVVIAVYLKRAESLALSLHNNPLGMRKS